HIERYEDNIIGVITDGRFPNAGGEVDNAGLELVKEVRTRHPHMPILFQSKNLELKQAAEELETTFLHKEDPALHRGIENFMKHEMSFGDFIFRDEDGEEIARAGDLSELRSALQVVPVQSVRRHAERNHFSHWMRTRTEFDLAAKVRPMKLDDFDELEGVRDFLIHEIGEFLSNRRARQVRNYEKGLEKVGGFQRLGSGTLGGKGRGLAFFYTKMPDLGITELFPDVQIVVPKSLVIATDVFEEFISRNSLEKYATDEFEDEEVKAAFLKGGFLEEEDETLRRILNIVNWPLAVRSSSLLEDALHQPFAGVYDTFFLPNDHDDDEVRATQLSDAIKLVFASTYSKRAKAYVAATPNSIEEEKMAVVVQEMVGSEHDGLFYPLISGVARSRNHYPVAPMKSEDGVAAIALGLGVTVATGGKCLRFSPVHPRRILQLAYTGSALHESQNSFWALNIGLSDKFEGMKLTKMLAENNLSTAEQHGRLNTIASTYVASDDRLYDGVVRDGPRVLTFHGPLKRDSFPLPDILKHVLSTCEKHLSCPVEIEFAVDVDNDNEVRKFALLQLRPLLSIGTDIDVDMDTVNQDSVICASSLSLGSGIIEDIHDVVYVNPQVMNRMKTRDIVSDIENVNARLTQQNRPYILIGPGRWGSSDPSLGIPVAWSQISGAKAIVEARMGDIHVDPSQGTHFFQNIVSFNVGYLTITSQDEDIDWEWLDSHPAVFEQGPLRHIKVETGIRVLLDGKDGEAIIEKA
ncbi:MAG: PEP/pyruvate-binding domain-containing protein, partial [Candidatus Poseidoniaceae archaeon]|nr:PEP/pyruvate-binding domain-containing protein [Candidatus Poseidoniaceae archaeon]